MASPPKTVSHWKEGEPSARDLEIYHKVITSGRTQRSIAEEYDLSYGRVSQITSRVDVYMKGILLEEARLMRTRHHQRYERLFELAMEGWERSHGEVQVVTTKEVEIKKPGSKTGEKLPGIETTIRTEHKAGDSRFLTVMMELLEKQRNLYRDLDKEDDGFRYAGKSDEEIIRNERAKLDRMLESLQTGSRN